MTKQIILIIFILLSIILVCGCSVAAFKIYSRQFGRTQAVPENQFTASYKWHEIDQIKYSREEVRFRSGKNLLQGFIYGGYGDNGLVIFSHGLGGNADTYLSLIMFFVDNGWSVFAYNNTGVSGSEGKHVRGLTQSVIDLDATLQYVKETDALNKLPIMLIGHSWGGYATSAVLNYDHNVNAVVSLAAFNNGPEVFKEQGILTAGSFYHLLAPYFWTIQRSYFGKTMKLTAVDGINKTTIPVMIVQSADDNLIYAATTSIYAKRKKITNPRVEIVYFEGEDVSGHQHVYYSKAAREYRQTANENWQRYSAENDNASLSRWAQEYNYNKIQANELNSELMQRINLFFINAR